MDKKYKLLSLFKLILIIAFLKKEISERTPKSIKINTNINSKSQSIDLIIFL